MFILKIVYSRPSNFKNQPNQELFESQDKFESQEPTKPRTKNYLKDKNHLKDPFCKSPYKHCFLTKNFLANINNNQKCLTHFSSFQLMLLNKWKWFNSPAPMVIFSSWTSVSIFLAVGILQFSSDDNLGRRQGHSVLKDHTP